MELIYFIDYHNAIPPRLQKQTISFYELTFVFKGSLTYLINGNEYRVQEGTAVYLPANSIRERLQSEQRATYASFNFLVDTPPELPTVIPKAVNNECNLLIACAEEIKRKYYPNGEKQIALLCRCLLENLGANLKLAQEHPLVFKIKSFVNNRLSEKITLQKIGEETYFSPLYCETVFKRETGVSIIRFVLERRIEEAKRLLSEGSLPLKKIAEAVGFEDYNYFSRAFKKSTGLTPREYKNSVSIFK